ncbi:MAG: hypothetical protein FWC26_06680 [Fibromonadales bacterium]|nr:hypothetical protein [Fibromonadales bacterium]
MNIKFLLFAASISLAIAITSCSSNNDENENFPGDNPSLRGDTLIITRTYVVEEMASDFFTIFEEEYYCNEDNGKFGLEREYMEYPRYYSREAAKMPYEINDGILNLWDMQFKGTSSSLVGTWTQDSLLKCKSEYSDCSEALYFRKAMEELIFTQDSLTITEHICLKDRYRKDGEIRQTGIWWKSVNCNTFEISKGSEKVTIIYEGFKQDEQKLIYKGKTCSSSDYSNSEKEIACKNAYDKSKAEGGSSYRYYNELAGPFKKCIENKSVPEWSYEILTVF